MLKSADRVRRLSQSRQSMFMRFLLFCGKGRRTGAQAPSLRSSRSETLACKRGRLRSSQLLSSRGFVKGALQNQIDVQAY
jgi:hypothetical protein